MREGTSGLLLTEYESGGIMIEVVDYGVSEFDGSDWECQYSLNKENADVLRKELQKLHSGDLEEMLIAQFGKDFHILDFVKFCDERGIKYSHFTWCS